MNFMTACYWEKGNTHAGNQDSLCLQHVLTKRGRALLACVCDGMGGLEQGEIASGYAVEGVIDWFYKDFMDCLEKGGRKRAVLRMGRKLYAILNRDLYHYGRAKNIAIGTTAALLLIVRNHYYIFHMGDSRVYRIGKRVSLLTKDHAKDAHTLTKCLGMNRDGKPDVKYGRVKRGEAFLVCSDGFRHYTKREDLQVIFGSRHIVTEQEIFRRLREIGTRNTKRGETDDSSAVYVASAGSAHRKGKRIHD